MASLRDSYVTSLSALEQENQQLRQELAEVHAHMEASNQTWKDKYERALLQSQGNNSHTHDRSAVHTPLITTYEWNFTLLTTTPALMGFPMYVFKIRNNMLIIFQTTKGH